MVAVMVRAQAAALALREIITARARLITTSNGKF
jgi:hypothetical protein